MRQLAGSWGMVGVWSLLCGLLGSCGRSTSPVPDTTVIQRTNAALSSRKLPVLPADATGVRCWIGGTFAKYVNVKFTASPDQALDYLRRAGAAYYYEFRIEEQEYRILATHVLTCAPGNSDRPLLYSLAHRAGIRAEPWFESVYDIRHGWYYHYFGDAPARYFLYYDVDSQQFYVYWSYS
jgi:hypothetical protein